MDKASLFADLKNLKVNTILFKENEERTIAELRNLYKDTFS
tara:strand:+ start:357 stop:479 length:123 start_codon:yes stop_codon:yes gene_type:complete